MPSWTNDPTGPVKGKGKGKGKATQPGNPTHEVIRTIPGMNLQPGDLVDASGWRAAAKLERMRYIKPIVDAEALRARIAELESENKELRAGKNPKRG